MDNRGKEINIYLDDGSPTGIKLIKLGNWNGQVIVCPRARVSQLADWPESQRPGVYFLLGEDEETYKPRIYIGEAEDVLKRLRSQFGGKDFWKQAFIFTSTDENLTKAHVGYLESCMIEKAREYGRVILENTNSPKLPSLPRSGRATMDEYLDYARDILTTLGFPYLQPVIKKEATDSLSVLEKPKSSIQKDSKEAIHSEDSSETLHHFFFSGRGIDGRGVSTDEGFVVLAGSLGNLKTTRSLNQKWEDMRNSLIAQKQISKAGHQIRFDKDVLFNSPSAAATVLAGGMRNGQDVWKDKANRTLKQYEENLSDMQPESTKLEKPSESKERKARRHHDKISPRDSVVTAKPKKIVSFVLKGKRYEAKNQSDAYIHIIELMERDNPGFLDILAPRLAFSKTKALARSREDLADRKHLERQPNIAVPIVDDEWWIYTKIDRNRKIRYLKTACTVAGLAFGNPDGLMVDF